MFHFQIFAQAPRKLTQDARFSLKIENESKVLVPTTLDNAVKYPLVIFLPYTGGSGQDYYDMYLNSALSEKGGMGYREVEIDINVLIDSLKRTPTEDELNRYIFLEELKNSANKKEPSDSENFTLLLQSLFGEDAQKKAFIALIPDGTGSTNDHSWEGFEACIFRYENKILADIEAISQKYTIDKSKIILAGFSLGGDVSWAISQRYPEKFKGAIISGSRCGYAEKGMMQRQAKQGVKYYIAMGEYETETRMKGAKYAITLLNNAGIKNQFKTIQYGEHEATNFEQFKEALNFILFE
jgi:predicted esterase